MARQTDIRQVPRQLRYCPAAVTLVPLMLWFVASIIAHLGSDYAGFVAWMNEFPTAMLMIPLLLALSHTTLGLQVIIEDYVHSDPSSWQS